MGDEAIVVVAAEMSEEGENFEMLCSKLDCDARLPVTQSDDPLTLSGGHFTWGASKTPPRSARERGRVVVHVVVALYLADGKNIRCSISEESPISNGRKTVGGAKTRFLFDKIGHI